MAERKNHRRVGMAVVALAWCWASPTAAAPHSWAEGSAEHGDGASRDYYNRGARLRWRGEHGDWIDAEGTPQGEVAWVQHEVVDTNAERWETWVVTDLVNAQRAGELRDEGFMLRTLGGGLADFRSRQYENEQERPRLVVTADGTTTELVAIADTHLEQSTAKPVGNSSRLRVGDGGGAFVRFDLGALAGQDVEHAELRLFTHAQFGSATIGVFLPDPGSGSEPVPLQLGIAAEFEDDAGLADHPDVLLFEDFQSEPWKDHWSRHGGDYRIIEDDGSIGFAPLHGRALAARLGAGKKTALNTTYDFAEKIGEEPEEIYFRYYLRLGSDWDQTVDGGKLPGIAGTYGVAGWGGRKSNGSNGWSARGQFRLTIPQGGNPLAGHTPIGSYVYHADMAGNYGDPYVWVEGWDAGAHGGLLQTERWYCIEHYVKMNTPGENDGILRGWVDGRLSVERDALRFRDVDTLSIEQIWMNIYHGGTTPSPYDQHAFIDNVVIARSYVGPIPAEDPPPGDDGGNDSGATTGNDPSDSGTTDPQGDDGPDPTGGATDAPPASGDPEADGGADGCSCRSTPGTVPWLLWLLWLPLLRVSLRAARPRCPRTGGSCGRPSGSGRHRRHDIRRRSGRRIPDFHERQRRDRSHRMWPETWASGAAGGRSDCPAQHR